MKQLLFLTGAFLILATNPAKAQQLTGNERWDDQFGSDITFVGSVEASIVWNGELYVGSRFRDAEDENRSIVAKWDGRSWQSVGNIISQFGGASKINDFAVKSDTLYAAGFFDDPVSGDRVCLIRWVDASWEIADPTPCWDIYRIVAQNDLIYAAFNYNSSLHDEELGGIIAWDGSQRINIPDSLRGPINDLVIWNDQLVAGGRFTTGSADDIPRTSVIWNGSEWMDMGAGAPVFVITDMNANNNTLFAAGELVDGDVTASLGLASWDGTAWKTYPSSEPDTCCSRVFNSSLAVTDDHIYVAGDGYDVPNGARHYSLMRWDRQASTWEWLRGESASVHEDIFGMTVYDEELIILASSSVETWNESGWGGLHAFSGGLNGPVLDMKAEGKDIYVVGTFSQAGGISTTGIARWDGNQWHSVGNGLNGWANAIDVDGTHVYVGGYRGYPYFTVGDGHVLARWNGSSWKDLSDGLIGQVFHIEAQGDDVYISGLLGFDREDVKARIAKWENNRWAFIRENIIPSDLMLFGDTLYMSISGFSAYQDGLWLDFSNEDLNLLGGSNVRVTSLQPQSATFAYGLEEGFAWRFHEWLGSSWSPITPSTWDFGAQTVGTLYDFATIREKVYAVGNVSWDTEEPGVFTRGLLEWDGTQWAGVGQGSFGPDPNFTFLFPETISEVEAATPHVYVGGDFWKLGGQSSKYFGRILNATSTSGEPGPTPHDTPFSYEVYPNPARTFVRVDINQEVESHVKVELYDTIGRRIDFIIDGLLARGSHALQYNTSTLAAGTYLIRIQSNTRTEVVPISVY